LRSEEGKRFVVSIGKKFNRDDNAYDRNFDIDVGRTALEWEVYIRAKFSR
jgi:hypothetical protein